MYTLSLDVRIERHHRLNRWRAISLLVCFAQLIGGCTTEPALTDASLQAKVLQVIRDNPKIILESVTTYEQKHVEEQQRAQAGAAQKNLNQVDLKQLASDSPATGSLDNKVLLFEFSDFQCPFCAKAHGTLKSFVDKHRDEVTLIYKYLPLTDIHRQAEAAARAGWAAHQQGKFWVYHDALFARQKELGEPLFIELATSLGLDVQKFKADFASLAAKAAIEKDLAWARQLNIGATPHFLMNRIPIEGAQPITAFESALQQAANSGSTAR